MRRGAVAGAALAAALAVAACAGSPGPPAEAPPPAGETFRAAGQEPGWMAEVAPGGTLRALLDYGEREVTLPAPEPARAGRRLVWATRSDAVTVRLEAEEAPCSDTMSGEPYSHTVLLVVDGRELRGCGRFGAGPPLEGVWSLVELDGRPARRGPGDAFPRLRLEEGGRVGGDTGCNTFTGAFRLDGERISFGPLAMTRRACVDPALQGQETRYAAALARAERARQEEGFLVLLAGDEAVARFERVAGP